MTTQHSGPRGPKASWMAWNKPGGSSNGGGRRGGSGGLGGLFDSLRAGGFEAALAMQLAFGLLLVAQALSFIPLLRARQEH